MNERFIFPSSGCEALRARVPVLETEGSADSFREKGQVLQFQQALGDLKQDVGRDLRELYGNDSLWLKIQKAVNDGSSYTIEVIANIWQYKGRLGNGTLCSRADHPPQEACQ